MGICGETQDNICYTKKDKRKSKIFEGVKSINSSKIDEKTIDNTKGNNIKSINKEEGNNKSINNTNESNNPKSSLRESNNEKSNFSNKKIKSQNIVIDKIDNLEKNKIYSKSENKQYNNKKKKNNSKASINKVEKLTDSNMNGGDPNDNKEPKKSINNSYNNEKERKFFTNTGEETPILERPDNNINDDDPNDKEKTEKSIKISDNINNPKIFTNVGKSQNNSIKNESINKNFDINKNYFLGCPLCLNVPYIKNLIYDFNKKNIFVTYICKCELKERENRMNLNDLIIEKEPKNECQSHYSKELIYYCKTCKMKICIDCYKEEHNNHKVNNNYLMSEENENLLVTLMDKFKEYVKGYDILVKIHDEYNKNKSTNNIEELNDNISYKVVNDSNNLGESKINGNKIICSKNIVDSQADIKIKQSEIIPNFKNSSLETIIKQQSKNNNQNSNNSNIDNNKINNPKIEESQNANGFSLFGKDSQINPLNDSFEKPKNNSLYSIKEEKDDNKNMTNNEENNITNQAQSRLKHYYNSKTLKGHEDRVISLIQLESGYLASGSRDGSIKIWDINKSKIISEFKERGQVICLLEFEPNKLLAGTSENNIGLWDLNKKEENSTFNFEKHSLWVNCLVKIDKNTFASASNDCKIYIWDYYNRKFLFELAEHTDCILALIKLNNGRLCSGSADLTIKIWNLEKREIEYELIGHNSMIKNLYQLKNGILLSSDERTLIIWKNFGLFKSINCRSDYRNFCQIDDNCLACASKDNSIDLMDLNNYQIYDFLKGHYSNVICVIKLKDNKLASCSLDKTIKIWEQKY